MKKTASWAGVLVLLFFLNACNGGGGGGTPAPGPPATTLTGSVTDTALDPVAGASVEILGTTSTTTTDAVGRYSFTALPALTEYTLKFSGPGPSYFPTFAKATLVENSPTVLDVYLTRGGNNPVPTVDAAAGGVVNSTAFIGGVQLATLDLAANELEDAGGTPYGGIADVYLAPIDVGKLGFGLASYQTTLGSVFAALTASSEIVELFGSAAVAIDDAAGNPLSLKVGSTSTLEIPIPAALRGAAPSPASFWHLNEATGAWVEDGTAAVDVPGSPTAYTGTISRIGIWRAGLKHDYLTLTEITGQVTYNNSTPASGATIYVNGVDYAYQDQTTTNANGNFSFLAKAVGTVTIHCVVSANGAQWTHEQQFVNPTTANIVLPFAPPVAGAAAQQTIIVDNRDTTVGTGPDVLGYILASGRQLFDPDPDADITATNVADFTFVANQIDVGNGLITITPTLSGSSIQEVTGQTFETLTVAPTLNYLPDPPGGATSFAIPLDPAVATLPILVVVKTAQGHYGKISIDVVTDVSNISGAKEAWQITFRHAFSLTGNF